jgi:hypothetical protein
VCLGELGASVVKTLSDKNEHSTETAPRAAFRVPFSAALIDEQQRF